MAFDPVAYSAVAARLVGLASAGEEPVDALLRAAIGRYYYASLLGARDYIERTEPIAADRAETTHRWVIEKLRASAEMESGRLGTTLNSMRESRNAAEYGDDVRDLPGEAKRMAGRCDQCLRDVTTLTRRGTRTR